MSNVFVSRPTKIAGVFREGVDGFLEVIESLGLSARTLGTTDYPSESPLDEVIKLMDECVGAVILGVPQLTIVQGAIRGERLKHQLVLGTEWNHIEAGLAYARELPLLVIHHLEVGRGIFDRGALSNFIYEVDMGQPGWPIQREIQGAIRTWHRRCQAPKPKTLLVPEVHNPLECPNCSSPGRPFLMSPIPVDFQKLECATHECAKCKYKTWLDL